MNQAPPPASSSDVLEPVLADAADEQAALVDVVIVHESTDPKHAPAQRDRLLDNPWFVLGLLCFVTLFLGFPVLWRCRAFSPTLKVIITLAVTLESILIFWGFYAIMMWSWQRVSDSL